MPRTLTTSGAVGLLALALLVSGCDAGGDAAPGSTPATSSSSVASSPPAPPAPPGPAEKLGLVEGWGPSQSDLDRAARQVRRLSLPELAGQVIVASYAGTAAPLAPVQRLHLGGVIAFTDNVTTTGQIRDVNRRLQRATHRRWPLLTSVDQEGGLVERVKSDATRFPAFMSAGAAHDVSLTEQAYAASGSELAGLGFTVDYAPDADVTSGPGDPTIGARSAGSDPDLVSGQAVAAARGYLAGGVVPVLKHFPGHGSVPADSHLTLPVQTKSLKALRADDLKPFEAAIKAGLPALMVGHLDVRAVDPGTPSSLSRKVVTGLLRDDLGFGGVVFTDALDMGAIVRGYGPGRASVQALRAGADVLLMPPDPAAARAAIITAVKRGNLPRTRLRQAATRMVALLHYQHALRAQTDAGEPGSARVWSRRLSAAALTSAAGPCSGALTASTVSPYGDPAAVATFVGAARAAGLTVLLRRTPPAALTTAEPKPVRKPVHRHGKHKRRYRQKVKAWKKRERQRQQALAAWESDEDRRLATGHRIAFVTSAGATADVVVAVDTPYVLGRSRAPIKLATYGSTPGAMTALVAVLRGEATAPGRLPVPVRGVRRGC